MPVELIERAMDALPEVDFVNAYGLTETSSTVSVLTPDDHREAIAATTRRAAGSARSAARCRRSSWRSAMPTATSLAPGERGEIYVRGEQVAGEYLGRSVLTDDGWFPTNDAGYLDEDGFLYLDGRLDDVIVRGAENLSPGEIEDDADGPPGGRRGRVVGIPDPEWGEAVAAAVVLAPGAERRRGRAEGLRAGAAALDEDAPRSSTFRDELPYNETGKLLRRVIREELGSAS